MELKEIKDLIKSFDESESTYLELVQNDMSLKIKKASNNTMEPVSMAQPIAIQQPIAMQQTTMTQPSVMSQIPVATQQPAELQTEVSPEPAGEIVKAPLVGIFYAAPSPDADAYVQVGSKVEEGQVLCLIEAMKMMSEITAPKSGTITKIYVKNQDVVGFEDPLFVIGE